MLINTAACCYFMCYTQPATTPLFDTSQLQRTRLSAHNQGESYCQTYQSLRHLMQFDMKFALLFHFISNFTALSHFCSTWIYIFNHNDFKEKQKSHSGEACIGLLNSKHRNCISFENDMPHKLRENNFAVQVVYSGHSKTPAQTRRHSTLHQLITICIKRRFFTIGRPCRKAHSTSSGASKLTGHFFGTFLRYQQCIHFIYCILYLPPRSGH